MIAYTCVNYRGINKGYYCTRLFSHTSSQWLDWFSESLLRESVYNAIPDEMVQSVQNAPWFKRHGSFLVWKDVLQSYKCTIHITKDNEPVFCGNTWHFVFVYSVQEHLEHVRKVPDHLDKAGLGHRSVYLYNNRWGAWDTLSHQNSFDTTILVTSLTSDATFTSAITVCCGDATQWYCSVAYLWLLLLCPIWLNYIKAQVI